MTTRHRLTAGEAKRILNISYAALYLEDDVLNPEIEHYQSKNKRRRLRKRWYRPEAIAAYRAIRLARAQRQLDLDKAHQALEASRAALDKLKRSA